MSEIPHHEVAPLYDQKMDVALARYKNQHAESIKDPGAFWSRKATEYLDWFQPFDPSTALQGGFEHGDVRWFAGGKLNLCYNAIDRHVSSGKANQTALIFEGDEPTNVLSYTYAEMLRETCQIANALMSQGVRKGDVVTIYMPMAPKLAFTMLACARIGAVHSVVFAGFSSEALAQRISAARCKYVVTSDSGHRGGKKIPLKDIVNDAMTKADCSTVVEKVMVFEQNYDPVSETASFEMHPKDIRMDKLVGVQRPYCVPETMDAEDNLFILYTSGSTGQPKGLLHTTGGYGLFAAFTMATSFDLQPGDIFACVADCGWITGHTYVVYGPLLNGGTTFMFESTPIYPDPGRYWDMVQRHKINIFYTAPTAIRLVMRYGDEIPKQYDLSSLKVLGTVGEPINPEAWRWYYEVVGREKCSVVDTYWQTETGGHVITNIPGVTPMKPGSCTLPMFGIDAVVLDPHNGHPLEGPKVRGVMAIRQPWPGMARTCLGDHDRYMLVYFKPYQGYYFTGDSVYRDEDGYYFIIGRVDDVLNVSGHRIGTAEVESALVAHPAVAQAAVVGQPHDIKGQSICAFVMLTVGFEESEELRKELRMMVRSEIGGFAAPDVVVISQSLPMTRSGKIMRRILRKIVSDELDTIGDTSTLADPSVVDALIEKFKAIQGKK
jgi:acetyl-CoA synthetase